MRERRYVCAALARLRARAGVSAYLSFRVWQVADPVEDRHLREREASRDLGQGEFLLDSKLACLLA
jgi:hypothetical protein